MEQKEAVIKEFEQVRDKYMELIKKLVDMKVPGVKVQAKSTCATGLCDVGG